MSLKNPRLPDPRVPNPNIALLQRRQAQELARADRVIAANGCALHAKAAACNDAAMPCAESGDTRACDAMEARQGA